jgi:ribose transport system ATP-binding protein
MIPNALELRGICKSFPGVRALDGVDFTVAQGEVHGLVGENGAGKSTLIKIIAGVYQLDAGEILVHGQPVEHATPRIIEELGIQFIHQELNLVPEFTVAQAIFMGQETTYRRWLPIVDNRRMEREAERLIAETLGVTLPGKRLVRDLSVAERQLVQIAKALRSGPSIVAFDEPTAPLARREVEALFSVIRTLKSKGIAIIYISHYLSEISEICDRVSVLRNGRNVSTTPMAETSVARIVSEMVGHSLDEMHPDRHVQIGAPLLEVEHLSRAGMFDDISFTLHHGEVVGVTGLLGSGTHEVAETIFGLRKPDAGRVVLEGKPLTRLTSSKAVAQGLGMVPKDRRNQGVVLSMSVGDNLNLASLHKVSTAGLIRARSARAQADHMIARLRVRTPNRETAVRYLSGGNQQKTVIGRWLCSDAKVFVLDEPTLGVDVGAKIEIYNLINEMVAAGAGVFLISSDLPELLGASDRILVMFRGRIVKELNAKTASADQVLYWATGGGSEAESDDVTAVLLGAPA